MKEAPTNSGKTYSVHTANGCTVSDDSGWSKEIEAPDGYFTAHGSTVYLSDDEATMREVFKLAPVVGGSGGGGGAATGEKFGKMMFAGSDDGSGNVTFSADLTVKHATWFDNSQNASKARVIPAAWKNEVMTCYLKTSVPVELSGVQWLYGEPAMMTGFTFVIALQQIDASTVLANLAYSLKQ